MRWLNRLQERWKVKSVKQVAVILLVFALTGTTVVYISKPSLVYLFQPFEVPVWAKIVYYVLVLPVYNVFLLIYGFMFGQFSFFWILEKKFLKRIFSIFGILKNH